MNKEVTVTGMEVKTTVSSNLQIAATNSEAAFANSLTQNVKALLEPVSTINGVDYYYTLTDHVLGDGDASDSAKNINLTKMNLLYNNAGVTTDKAWTAAIFVHSTSAGTAYSTDWASSDVVTMNKMTGAANFTANKAIGDVNDTVGLNDLDYGTSSSAYGATGAMASVAANTTAYYKVTVRLWLEGEDTSCTTTIYYNKTAGYTLDLKFEMDTATSAVTAISSTTP